MEMELPERKVLEKLNDVSTAKRLANMVSSGLGQPCAALTCVIGTT